MARDEDAKVERACPSFAIRLPADTSSPRAHAPSRSMRLRRLPRHSREVLRMRLIVKANTATSKMRMEPQTMARSVRGIAVNIGKGIAYGRKHSQCPLISPLAVSERYEDEDRSLTVWRTA